MVDPEAEDLEVTYSWVSLVAWIWVCVIVLGVSGGALLSEDRDLGDVAAGAIGAPLALVSLIYLVSRLALRTPRYVIGSAGFEDHRPFQPVLVPWSTVCGVTIGGHSRGRRCIFLAIENEAMIDGSWPWWMRGWGWQPGEVRLSDWLVRTSLDEMEAAIRSRVGRS